MPIVGVRADEPLLQVARAEVEDLAELAGLEQLARQPHRGHEAVVERAHVLDAGRGDALPGVVGLGGVAPQRLLADHVLAGLGGGDARPGVQVVGPAVVEELDALVGDQLAPVGDVAVVAVAVGGLGDRLLVAAGDRDQARARAAAARSCRTSVR